MLDPAAVMRMSPEFEFVCDVAAAPRALGARSLRDVVLRTASSRHRNGKTVPTAVLAAVRSTP
jgi:hypothetical protein